MRPDWWWFRSFLWATCIALSDGRLCYSTEWVVIFIYTYSHFCNLVFQVLKDKIEGLQSWRCKEVAALCSKVKKAYEEMQVKRAQVKLGVPHHRWFPCALDKCSVMEKTVLTARKIRMFTASWILKYLWSCPLQCFAIFLCYYIATLICVKQKILWFSTCYVNLLMFSSFTLHKSLQALYCIFLSENKWTTLSKREVVHTFLLHSPGYV